MHTLFYLLLFPSKCRAAALRARDCGVKSGQREVPTRQEDDMLSAGTEGRVGAFSICSHVCVSICELFRESAMQRIALN